MPLDPTTMNVAESDVALVQWGWRMRGWLLGDRAPPPPDRQEYTMNNLVAKHAHKYNRAKVFKSKKDYSRKRKDWFK